MGIAGARLLATAGLSLVAVLASDAPWTIGPVLVAFALAARWDPRFVRVGLVAALAVAVDAPGVVGGVVLAGAIVVGALRWTWVSTGILVVVGAIAGKQALVEAYVPQALDSVPRLLLTGVFAAAAWAGATPADVVAARRGSLLLLAAAAVLGVRFALAVGAAGEGDLVPAGRIQAQRVLYDWAARAVGPCAEGACVSDVLRLIRAVPDRDEAALLIEGDLGMTRALDAGWRPWRAEGREVAVAIELERRGRGGEALRLLGRAPRVGAVDWYRALFERTQGVRSAWRGGMVPGGYELPGTLPLHRSWETDSYEAILFTATRTFDSLDILGSGTAYGGPPSVAVTLDAEPVRRWILDGDAILTLRGPFEAGPHRIELRFDNDRAGPDGDRNVTLLEMRGR